MNAIVFISGSRSIGELGQEAKQSLDKIMSKGLRVVIGDCYGVDRLVQIYLSEHGYADSVTVYTIHREPRNFVDSAFHHCYVAATHEPAKNSAMAFVANFGLAIWDGPKKLRNPSSDVPSVQSAPTGTKARQFAGRHAVAVAANSGSSA